MHTAIFSAKERLIIKEYLESGTKTHGFRLIKHRVKQNKSKIIDDYTLMTKFYEKLTTEESQ